MPIKAPRSSCPCQLSGRVDTGMRPFRQHSPCTRARTVCSSSSVQPSQYERPVQKLGTPEDVDAVLQRVGQQSKAWHLLPRDKRIHIVEEIRRRVIKCSLQLGRRGAEVRSALLRVHIMPHAVPRVGCLLIAILPGSFHMLSNCNCDLIMSWPRFGGELA